MDVVEGIKKHIRKTDMIIRLGGDEFLLVFPGTSIQQAELIWSRIKEEYQQLNDKQTRRYFISASHGLSEFYANADERIDAVINDADEKMYAEKRAIKQNLQTIRQQ